MFTLDPGANTRQSDRTSGFTSPSHFSSPSFGPQPLLCPRVGTPVTPDSVGGSPHPADTVSDTSGVSAGPSPSKLPALWGNPSQDRKASEEEGSHTYSTLKPPSLEDPVVLSL